MPLADVQNAAAFPYPTSTYITRRLASHGLATAVKRVVEMLETLAGNPITRAAGGHLFELLVIGMFRNIGGDFPLAPLLAYDILPYTLSLSYYPLTDQTIRDLC
jgi:hypothetical protein